MHSLCAALVGMFHLFYRIHIYLTLSDTVFRQNMSAEEVVFQVIKAFLIVGFMCKYRLNPTEIV